jgi:hypothetical protein
MNLVGKEPSMRLLGNLARHDENKVELEASINRGGHEVNEQTRSNKPSINSVKILLCSFGSKGKQMPRWVKEVECCSTNNPEGSALPVLPFLLIKNTATRAILHSFFNA